MRPAAQGDSSQSEFIRRECFSSIPLSETLLRCLKNADTDWQRPAEDEISGQQAGYLSRKSPRPIHHYWPLRISASCGSSLMNIIQLPGMNEKKMFYK